MIVLPIKMSRHSHPNQELAACSEWTYHSNVSKYAYARVPYWSVYIKTPLGILLLGWNPPCNIRSPPDLFMCFLCAELVMGSSLQIHPRQLTGPRHHGTLTHMHLHMEAWLHTNLFCQYSTTGTKLQIDVVITHTLNVAILSVSC